MGYKESTTKNGVWDKYQELMDTIDEMDGEDQQQVEESKSMLRALVDEALNRDYMKG